MADPIKVSGCSTSEAVGPLPLGGSGGMLPGMLPKKILESRIPEMTFPEFNFSTNYNLLIK